MGSKRSLGSPCGFLCGLTDTFGYIHARKQNLSDATSVHHLATHHCFGWVLKLLVAIAMTRKILASVIGGCPLRFLMYVISACSNVDAGCIQIPETPGLGQNTSLPILGSPAP